MKKKTAQKNAFKNTDVLRGDHTLSKEKYFIRLENDDETSKYEYELILE